MPEFRRSPSELRKVAAIWWPKELVAMEANTSVIPMLLKSQEKFISLLDLADQNPEAWASALETTADLPGNLFLKHLMVLSDIGGEQFKRLPPELKKIFPNAKMHYAWNTGNHEYAFTSLLDAKLGNVELGVDGKSLATPAALSPLMRDAAMLLLHGGAADEEVPFHLREKCVIGAMIGRHEEIERFVKQRYIFVSRITGGATANAMGQMTQDAVISHLTSALPQWEFVRNGSIPGISQTGGRTLISFDVVAKSPSSKFVAIEVSFQVTTNSTIERKAGQAQQRASVLRSAGHSIAYVIDGAGNFERSAALHTICANSDCTVAMTPDELDVLSEFLQSAG